MHGISLLMYLLKIIHKSVSEISHITIGHLVSSSLHDRLSWGTAEVLCMPENLKSAEILESVIKCTVVYYNVHHGDVYL